MTIEIAEKMEKGGESSAQTCPATGFSRVFGLHKGKERLEEGGMDKHESHEWRAPQEGDSRAPCPALNALANHGYLPHDGKNITNARLIYALKAGLHCTTFLAYFLCYGGRILMHFSPFRSTFSLHDLAQHANLIEHTASLIHPDAFSSSSPIGNEDAKEFKDAKSRKETIYAPEPVHLGMLKQFLENSIDGEHMDSRSVAAVRVRREDSYAPDFPDKIDLVHQEVARGEIALVLGMFGISLVNNDGSIVSKEIKANGAQWDRVPLDVIQTFMVDERIPEDWKPTRKQGFLQTVKMSSRIRGEMKKLRRGNTSLSA